MNTGESIPAEGIEVESETCHHHHFPYGKMIIIDGCLCLSFETEDGLDAKIFARGEWLSARRYIRPEVKNESLQ